MVRIPLSELPPGACVVRALGGVPVAVFNAGGDFFALDDRCPHAGAPLSDGDVADGVVTCRWHGWRFRLADGVWADAPRGRVRVGCYAVRVDGDEVVVGDP